MAMTAQRMWVAVIVATIAFIALTAWSQHSVSAVRPVYAAEVPHTTTVIDNITPAVPFREHEVDEPRFDLNGNDAVIFSGLGAEFDLSDLVFTATGVGTVITAAGWNGSMLLQGPSLSIIGADDLFSCEHQGLGRCQAPPANERRARGLSDCSAPIHAHGSVFQALRSEWG